MLNQDDISLCQILITIVFFLILFLSPIITGKAFLPCLTPNTAHATKECKPNRHNQTEAQYCAMLRKSMVQHVQIKRFETLLICAQQARRIRKRLKNNPFFSSFIAFNLIRNCLEVTCKYITLNLFQTVCFRIIGNSWFFE